VAIKRTLGHKRELIGSSDAHTRRSRGPEIEGSS